jgi:hypothetical protein
MKFSRRIVIATALLALAAITLVACGKATVTGSAGINSVATSGSPSGSPTPSVAPPPPPPHSTTGHGSTPTASASGGTTTAAASGSPTLIIHTGIHVLTNYSIVPTGNCFWLRTSDNVLNIGAYFTLTRGTFGGATVPLVVTNDKTSDQYSVIQPVNNTFPVRLGSGAADQTNPFLNTTVTLTAKISPTFDDNAADNVATVTIYVPTYTDMLNTLSIGGSSATVTCSF